MEQVPEEVLSLLASFLPPAEAFALQRVRRSWQQVVIRRLPLEHAWRAIAAPWEALLRRRGAQPAGGPPAAPPGVTVSIYPAEVSPVHLSDGGSGGRSPPVVAFTAADGRVGTAPAALVDPLSAVPRVQEPPVRWARWRHGELAWVSFAPRFAFGLRRLANDYSLAALPLSPGAERTVCASLARSAPGVHAELRSGFCAESNRQDAARLFLVWDRDRRRVLLRAGSAAAWLFFDPAGLIEPEDPQRAASEFRLDPDWGDTAGSYYCLFHSADGAGVVLQNGFDAPRSLLFSAPSRLRLLSGVGPCVCTADGGRLLVCTENKRAGRRVLLREALPAAGSAAAAAEQELASWTGPCCGGGVLQDVASSGPVVAVLVAPPTAQPPTRLRVLSTAGMLLLDLDLGSCLAALAVRYEPLLFPAGADWPPTYALRCWGEAGGRRVSVLLPLNDGRTVVATVGPS